MGVAGRHRTGGLFSRTVPVFYRRAVPASGCSRFSDGNPAALFPDERRTGFLWRKADRNRAGGGGNPVCLCGDFPAGDFLCLSGHPADPGGGCIAAGRDTGAGGDSHRLWKTGLRQRVDDFSPGGGQWGFLSVGGGAASGNEPVSGAVAGVGRIPGNPAG